ncbi:hypothetical protein [Micromonospora sp. WMMD708]|uniref:hypothetical protein n=1 Tax=Micromonospora sp. WMMD708 TaxID=3403464 RepID=UPI003BF53BC6
MNLRRSARRRPVSRAEAERLLDSTGSGTAPSTDDPLTRLLAAAAAPARVDELAGEQAALAAFRAARGAAAPGPAPAARRRPRLSTGVVAWIAALAATATAGVAFAAAALDRPAERAPGPVPSTTATATGDATDRPSPYRSEPQRQSPSRRPGGTAPGGGPPASPAPPGHGGPANTGKLVGQCRAYLAKSPPQRAKALTRPGYADLVAAAGGADQVEAYCRTLVPQRTPAKPSDAAGAPASPGGGPGPRN